jgi:DNA-binding transcriptional regulator YiaG
MSNKAKLSSRGERDVKALNQFADDLETGVPIESKYSVRRVRVIETPSFYSAARVQVVRELIGPSQEAFAQLLAVSLTTIQSWQRGLRQPSPIARRFLIREDARTGRRVSNAFMSPLEQAGTSGCRAATRSR